MATFFINTLIHSMLSIVTIVALVALFGTTKKDLIKLAKKVGIGFLGIARRAGLGYLIYHSDSQKYFYTITRKSAVEWMGSTYADAVMFSNWSKDAIAVVSRKQQINFA